MIQLMYAEYLKHKLFIVLLRIQQTPLVTKAINCYRMKQIRNIQIGKYVRGKGKNTQTAICYIFQ